MRVSRFPSLCCYLLAILLFTGCQPSPHHNETPPELRQALMTGLAECLAAREEPVPDSPSLQRRREFQIARLAKHLMNDPNAMAVWPQPGLDVRQTQTYAAQLMHSQDQRGRGMKAPLLMQQMTAAPTLTANQTWLLRAFCSAQIVEQRLPPPDGYWPDAPQRAAPDWQQAAPPR